MQKIQLAIFDMAGTTVNENNVVYKTLQETINEKGYDLSLDFVLEHGAGKEKHQAIIDLLKMKGKDDPQKVVSIARDMFERFKYLLKNAYKNLEVTSYDGVEELMIELKKANIKVALNTGYDKATAQLLIDKMNWKLGEQYDTLITSDDVKNGRPHPDMILKAMDVLEITNVKNVLKAGDSIIDIEEGKNASCGITVGVTTGAHTKKQLEMAKPTYILNSLTELKNILIG